MSTSLMMSDERMLHSTCSSLLNRSETVPFAPLLVHKNYSATETRKGHYWYIVSFQWHLDATESELRIVRSV